MWKGLIGVVAGAAVCMPCVAQSRTVALTFDDRPAVRAVDAREEAGINRDWCERRTGNPAELDGTGYELGNHTLSHADLNELTVDQFKAEVIGGEASLGKAPRFLRFPVNHAGETRE